ncbi:MAG: holo-ACP synthase [Cytophagaceae bacterium]|jgi:holo-[acyl-carrier protein] synthase|nr:holo-ACP synthase [Cytophagaceae bacterium]
MIFGIGTDIIEVDRIRKSIESSSFLDKIFTEAERAYCGSKINAAEHFAVRYAAKEAFFKALGTGYRLGMAFHEIEICHDDLGKPHIQLHGETQKFLQEKGNFHIHISLSHVKQTALAMVMIEHHTKS